MKIILSPTDDRSFFLNTFYVTICYEDGGFEVDWEAERIVQKMVQQPVYEMDIICFISFRLKSLNEVTERILKMSITG